MFNKNKDKAKSHETAVPPEKTPPAEPAEELAEAVAPASAQPAADKDAPAAEPPQPAAQELAAVKDRYLRLMADFDNFRKRQQREREEWIKRANEDLLGDLLPVIDHLELALGKSPDISDPVVAGVKLVYEQFLSLLDRYGVTPIDTKNQPFNPDWHEALSQMPSATVPANGIIDQFRRGWCLAGRLLRPAQVIVSSGAPAPEQPAAEEASVSD